MKKSHRIPFMASSGYMQMYPETREEALEQGARYYHKTLVNENPCRRPGHLVGALIHAKTNIHICCSYADCIIDYDNAVANGEPITQKDAKEKGLDYYWRRVFDERCGHSGKRTIDDKCWFCKQDAQTSKKERHNTPRQQALKDGNPWYMPTNDDPCLEGHIALRRVANGQCSQCLGADTSPREKTVQELYPDMVIDAEAAKALGFKVYRTGKPCHKGHTGWRYLSTKTCIQCLRS